MKTIMFANSLVEKCPDVLALWDYEKNKDMRPQDVSIHHKKKVWWRCEKGHGWQAPVNGVAANGTRCPYCAGYKAIPGETDLVTLFPGIAAQWDDDKNGKLDPRSLSPASHTSVWWKCAQGHSYKSAPYSRTGRYNSGCPFCTGRKALPGFNDLKTLKPELASEWYQPFNGDLTPEDVTLSSNKKVWWCCSENHVWEACVYSRTRYRGSGCPVCAGVAKSCKVGYFIDKAYPV
ncbi:MAG: zinc-ribbon domain-containing protein [Clostridia bacterium]|nr:zinc-ribbon domain-containing protein [Clostridia bacterium]